MKQPLSLSVPIARAVIAVFVGCVLALPASAQADIETSRTPALAFGGANGTPSSTADVLNVAGALTIGDVFVAVQIDHSWVGNIVMDLVSPSGTRVRLQGGDGGNADNLDLLYSGIGVPYQSQSFDFGCAMQPAPAQGSLSDFVGENAQGDWTLEIVDNFPGSADGVLVRWGLYLFAGSPGTLTPAVSGLSCTPTMDGASLAWTNQAAYLTIDLLVNGTSVAQLSGSANSFVLTGQAVGVPLVVSVQPAIPGSASACLESCTVVPFGTPAEPLPRKVVLAIIDGLRYSEGLGDPTRQHVPQMDALASQGVIIEPFTNDGVTYTNRAIPAILCGSWLAPITYVDPACGTNNLSSAVPTVHEYFRAQLNRPINDCVYVIGGVACPWRSSFHPSYGPDYWPLWIGESGGDDANLATAQSVIATMKPHFMTFYLSDVDHEGHGGDFNAYIAAIENADRIIGELWDTLQADPFYAGQTDLLITNDHGRHWYDFVGHGDNCSGCETIQLLAVGPSFKSGVVSSVPRSIPDITPTIGALLGFDTEFADGEVMVELFADITLPSTCSGDGGDQLGCTNCPCGNNALSGTTGGCLNSSGTSGQLIGSGVASATGDTLRFEVERANPGTFCVLISGSALAPNNAANPCFGLNSGLQSISFDGLRCVVSDFRRHGTRPTDANGDVGVTTNGWGGVDAPPAGLIMHSGLAIGQTRHYQGLYRESSDLVCQTALNTTDALTVIVFP